MLIISLQKSIMGQPQRHNKYLWSNRARSIFNMMNYALRQYGELARYGRGRMLGVPAFRLDDVKLMRLDPEYKPN